MTLRARNLKVGLLCSSMAIWVPATASSNAPLRETLERTMTNAPRPLIPLLPQGIGAAYAECQSIDALVAHDRGPFSDLISELRISAPSWLATAPSEKILFLPENRCFRHVEGIQVALCCDSSERATLRVPSEGLDDPDGDGIPTSLDVILGAKKALLLASSYAETYRAIPFPSGDIPRREGGAADVLVRALRNAGYDLQALVQEDVRRTPRAYAGIAKPDPNIDHRRIRNLFVYFERHFTSLPVEGPSKGTSYLPGDILFFDSHGDGYPERAAIVSDTLGPSGQPLVIGSWIDGRATEEVDLLQHLSPSFRFRVALPVANLPPRERGLQGWLDRHKISIPSAHLQIVVVMAPEWSSSHATVMRYERDSKGQLSRLSDLYAARLGVNGLGVGPSFIPFGETMISALPAKREGDQRSPLGFFELGTAFGWKQRAIPRWPFRQTTERDQWVKDPLSPYYNLWKTLSPSNNQTRFRDAERLDAYELAVVVRYNDAPIEPGAGSAVFLYSGGLSQATAGSTCLAEPDLSALLRWLDERKRPLLLQTAGHLYTGRD